MSMEAGYVGCAPLKDGVTLTDIKNLWAEHWDADNGDQAPELSIEIEGDLDVGEGSASVKNRQLDYDIYTTSWAFSEAWEAFLTGLAQRYASAGWINYDPQNHDDESTFGPSERACLEVVLKGAEADLEAARGRVAHWTQTLAALGAAP